ncbi:unnamed protein product [Clonostachys rosea f. rosea IK726]|uniref:Uncharacterized protein n=1 Tax=Clonostachys rosea f. rosea IK726 TaxID=1349383 RepID=A0ACA9TF48_BIOOC|nr:unnamed protein product [Clonostachys rosea f. rosea IK726]
MPATAFAHLPDPLIPLDQHTTTKMMTHEAAANAPYTRRPPSPPMIPVPVFTQPQAPGAPRGISMFPSFDNVDCSQLSIQDVKAIVGTQPYIAQGSADGWRYEQRRKAQRILDFIYLGPINAIRDFDFLRTEGITMVMVIRDSRMAACISSLDRAREELNVASQYVGVGSQQHLIQELPDLIRHMNEHLLKMRQISPKSGRVLVACETGNDRSAIVVAAYIMAVFGKSLRDALQFINMQRFCCIFDEDAKRLLLAWEDIIKARGAIARSQSDQFTASIHSKRRIEESDETDFDSGCQLSDRVNDLQIGGRRAFEPFVDREMS